MTTEELAAIFAAYAKETADVQQEAAKTYTDSFSKLYWLLLLIAEEVGISSDRFMELLDQAELKSRSERVEWNEQNKPKGFGK